MPAASAITPLDEEFVYGGCLYHHFGHFTAEFIHRILPSLQVYPTLRIIFLLGAPVISRRGVPQFITDIFPTWASPGGPC